MQTPEHYDTPPTDNTPYRKSALSSDTLLRMVSGAATQNQAERLPDGGIDTPDAAHSAQIVAVDPHKVFSRFCRAVEREAEKWKGSPAGDRLQNKIIPAMKRAAVIRFDKEDYESACAEVRAAKHMDLYLPPMMPFDDVIIYDAHGAVLFTESVDYEDGDRQAQHVAPDGSIVTASLLREVTVVAFGCDGPCEYEPATPTLPERRASKGSWWLAIGRAGITAPWADGKGRGMAWSGIALAMAFGFDEDPSVRTHLSMTDPEQADGQMAGLYRALRSDFYHAVMTALDELYYIDLPRHHLIEEVPKGWDPKAKRAKVPRAQQRPQYRLIDPGKVSTIRPVTARDGTQATRHQTPHPRRGYTRHLTSAHWKGKRWQAIRIRPTWVGPESWELGAYMYRVVVRRNDKRTGAPVTP